MSHTWKKLTSVLKTFTTVNILDGTLGVQKMLLEKYGTVYRVWFGNQLFVGLSEPADIDVSTK